MQSRSFIAHSVFIRYYTNKRWLALYYRHYPIRRVICNWHELRKKRVRSNENLLIVVATIPASTRFFYRVDLRVTTVRTKIDDGTFAEYTKSIIELHQASHERSDR